MNAYAAVASACVAAAALFGALWQLRGIGDSLRMDALSTLLDLEAGIDERRKRIALSSHHRAAVESDDQASEEQRSQARELWAVDIQSYLAALNRMAFCIYSGYFRDDEWQPEYERLFKRILQDETCLEFYNPRQEHKSIADLLDKWEERRLPPSL